MAALSTGVCEAGTRAAGTALLLHSDHDDSPATIRAPHG